jgi:hypothetical protein
MVEVDVQTASIVVASASVVAAAIYYSLQIHNQTRARQTDLLMRLSTAYDSKEFRDAVMKIASTEFKDISELISAIPPSTLLMVGNFYQRVGALLKRGLIDVNLVDDILYVSRVWERMESFAVFTRRQYDFPRFLDLFEYLYNEMKKREQKLSRQRKG